MELKKGVGPLNLMDLHEPEPEGYTTMEGGANTLAAHFLPAPL